MDVQAIAHLSKDFYVWVTRQMYVIVIQVWYRLSGRIIGAQLSCFFKTLSTFSLAQIKHRAMTLTHFVHKF